MLSLSDLSGFVFVTRLSNIFHFPLCCMAKIQGHEYKILPTATILNPKPHFVIQAFRSRLHSNFTINETILYNFEGFFFPLILMGFWEFRVSMCLFIQVSWTKTMIYFVPTYERLLISEKMQREKFISQEVNNSR